jgi:hypothetical protein
MQKHLQNADLMKRVLLEEIEFQKGTKIYVGKSKPLREEEAAQRDITFDYHRH